MTCYILLDISSIQLTKLITHIILKNIKLFKCLTIQKGFKISPFLFVTSLPLHFYNFTGIYLSSPRKRVSLSRSRFTQGAVDMEIRNRSSTRGPSLNFSRYQKETSEFYLERKKKNTHFSPLWNPTKVKAEGKSELSSSKRKKKEKSNSKIISLRKWRFRLLEVYWADMYGGCRWNICICLRFQLADFGNLEADT